ncbi:ribosomal protein S7A [Tieghemiomyces parasiticus]|uniref:40S ribosomal protein S7 n=1 Tax=Tieghemiomyces parasiticus TaxID=78921 RepID=A0A9W8DYF4_9FUNG|nr:ribosomal protein S7A [Tieghemiomyces parasiticus]KAJ1929289.1 ribosomal protein S7A [Tieghemiomyces parasiticus]
MSATSKIFKGEESKPTELTLQVAQALYDLEQNSPDLKKDLRPIQITSAREFPVEGNKKALVVFVPVPAHKQTQKVQQRLVRELEKKFSDRQVVFIAKRTVLPEPTRKNRPKQPRPYSRTVAHVQKKMLTDLVYPTDIVGKRLRVKVDGTKLMKVFLDQKDSTSMEYKLDTFSAVYKQLAGKDVTFEFRPSGLC